VRAGAHGAGQIAVTSLSVPSASLAFWRARLEGAGLSPRDVASPFDEAALHVTDPSGLVIGLVAGDDDPRAPWAGGPVATAHATRGLHSVTLLVRNGQPTIRFLEDLLGFAPVAESEGRTRVAVNGGGPGRLLDIVADPSAPGAVNGLGTVHHVALAVAGAEQQLRIRAEVVRRGIPVTPVMDRQYFQSIYFREPGGVLLEIATTGPGFATDESPEELGSGLKLPPWEESNRAAIEAALPQVRL
jgi:glyoxalase family protein